MANGTTIKERIARLEECTLNMGRGLDEIKIGIEKLNEKIDNKFQLQDELIDKQNGQIHDLRRNVASIEGVAVGKAKSNSLWISSLIGIVAILTTLLIAFFL